MSNKEWKPVPVNDVDIAFGGRTEELLPAQEDIPKEFWNHSNKWVKIVNDWMFNSGGLVGFDCEGKEGIDEVAGIRHIHCILKSFTPKHEHKIAGAAYLLSVFYDEFSLKYAKKEKSQIE